MNNKPNALMSLDKGFTLVELMIVVAIVAILAAIAMPAYSVYVQKNRLVVAKGMLNIARQEIQADYLRTGAYPQNIAANASPNNNSDYSRYFTVSIRNGNLLTTPTATNGYDGYAQMDVNTGKITYTCVKYPGACTSMKNMDK